MTNWVILAILSYFLDAVVAVFDKFLVFKKVKSPLVYAFYVSALTSVVLFLWPFDFSFLGLGFTLVALFSGISFFVANFLFYSTMMKGSVSRSVSIIGGVSPVIILGLSYFFLEERLPDLWLVAFFVLIMGSFFLSFGKGRIFSLYSFGAALFFAFSFFAAKVVYLETSFLNGFVWTRVGVLIPALFVLFLPSFRNALSESSLKTTNKLFLFFVSNKTLSAISFLVLNYAIMLGSVSVINALQGVKYALVFVLVAAFSFCCPSFVKESFAKKDFIQKISGVGLICLGVALLFV